MCRHVSSTFIHILLSILILVLLIFLFFARLFFKILWLASLSFIRCTFFRAHNCQECGKKSAKEWEKEVGTVAGQREREMKKFTLCFARKKLLHFRCYET